MENEEEKAKVVKIRIEYDDGTIKESSGKDAETIMNWWNSCETMAFIHGHEFDGTPLQIVRPKE